MGDHRGQQQPPNTPAPPNSQPAPPDAPPDAPPSASSRLLPETADDARAQVAQLYEALEAERAVIAAAERRVRGLTKLLEALGMLWPELGPTTPETIAAAEAAHGGQR